MTSNNTTNRPKQQAADQHLIDGLTKHAKDLPTLLISGNTVKNADIVTELLARIAAGKEADAARTAWQAAVQKARDQITSSRSLMSGVRSALQVAFQGKVEVLADFGLSPRKKPAPLTPEQKQASVAKAKATRAARHTQGPKQKAKITGTTAPAAAPAQPAAPAAPKS